MRKINLDSWPRREHFRLFNTFDSPHFSMCANLDLTALQPYLKEQGYSFNITVVWILACIANEMPEFRYRIHGEDVVEHEIVHPSTTIMGAEDLFTFCTLQYEPNFVRFYRRAVEQIEWVKTRSSILDDPGEDNLLFMTAIPWVSFTSFMHPLHLTPADSVPRFAWGKFFWEGKRLKMPLSVQAHHAVMDGLHMGRFYQRLQEVLDQPEILLAAGETACLR